MGDGRGGLEKKGEERGEQEKRKEDKISRRRGTGEKWTEDEKDALKKRGGLKKVRK